MVATGIEPYIMIYNQININLTKKNSPQETYVVSPTETWPIKN